MVRLSYTLHFTNPKAGIFVFIYIHSAMFFFAAGVTGELLETKTFDMWAGGNDKHL